MKILTHQLNNMINIYFLIVDIISSKNIYIYKINIFKVFNYNCFFFIFIFIYIYIYIYSFSFKKLNFSFYKFEKKI